MPKEEQFRAALNRHILLELNATVSHLQLSDWLTQKTLAGLSAWSRVEAKERVAASLALYQLFPKNKPRPQLGKIQSGRSVFNSLRDALAHAGAMRESLQQSLAALAELAPPQSAEAITSLRASLLSGPGEKARAILDKAGMFPEYDPGLKKLDAWMAAHCREPQRRAVEME